MEISKVVTFAKYHGCGNSFIILSNLKGEYDYIIKNSELIKKICDPDFGIGSDGILCISAHDEYDFAMEYYNAKYGRLSAFCGNGSRCSIQFAKDTGIIKMKTGTFLVGGRACDFVIDNSLITVKISDLDVSNIEKHSENNIFVKLGSSHHVKFVTNIRDFDVHTEGQAIRYSDIYNNKPDQNGLTGVNVNFVEDLQDSTFRVRTYERSVERETKACASGCLASAIAAAAKIGTDTTNEAKANFKHTMITDGGNLIVEFNFDGLLFSDITFTGPATKICTGEYYL